MNTLWYLPFSNYPKAFQAPLLPGEVKQKHLNDCFVYENVSEFIKYFNKRHVGLSVFTDLHSIDRIVFLSIEWSFRDLHDFNQLLTWCCEHEGPVIEFHNEGIEISPIHSEQMDLLTFQKIIYGLDRCQANIRRLRVAVTHSRSKDKKKAQGMTPIGFTKAKNGLLVPNWEARKHIRLIALLRDHTDLAWPSIAKRLTELYSKPGRIYPFPSKAVIPWSHQMCMKGYAAWQKIRKEENANS